MLEGPVAAEEDPVGFVLDVGELVRCGDDAEPWLIEIVAPLESVARDDDPQLPAALAAAHRIAVLADDRRAARDIATAAGPRRRAHLDAALGPFSELERGRSAGRFVASVEQRLAHGGDVLPDGPAVVVARGQFRDARHSHIAHLDGVAGGALAR